MCDYISPEVGLRDRFYDSRFIINTKKGGECICSWSIPLKEKLCVVTSVV